MKRSHLEPTGTSLPDTRTNASYPYGTVPSTTAKDSHGNKHSSASWSSPGAARSAPQFHAHPGSGMAPSSQAGQHTLPSGPPGTTHAPFGTTVAEMVGISPAPTHVRADYRALAQQAPGTAAAAGVPPPARIMCDAPATAAVHSKHQQAPLAAAGQYAAPPSGWGARQAPLQAPSAAIHVQKHATSTSTFPSSSSSMMNTAPGVTSAAPAVGSYSAFSPFNPQPTPTSFAMFDVHGVAPGDTSFRNPAAENTGSRSSRDHAVRAAPAAMFAPIAPGAGRDPPPTALAERAAAPAPRSAAHEASAPARAPGCVTTARRLLQLDVTTVAEWDAAMLARHSGDFVMLEACRIVPGSRMTLPGSAVQRVQIVANHGPGRRLAAELACHATAGGLAHEAEELSEHGIYTLVGRLAWLAEASGVEHAPRLLVAHARRTV